ncbi:MAG: 2-iminoacetate synthase ThiH [Chitinivibrionales bacterium]|nr:2-iminoacetate synthase ThiH [Chitinivibrionales bacterium]
MSFYEVVTSFRHSKEFELLTHDVTQSQWDSVMKQSCVSFDDFWVLLSDTGLRHLETLAQKSSQYTRQHFGNVISLFTPLYISNHCLNRCVYCSFAHQQNVPRHKLNSAEMVEEIEKIKNAGIRQILVLTGEDHRECGFSYIQESCELISGHFSSVGIEMYPLSQEHYSALFSRGLVDAVTVYQETYNEQVYKSVHGTGPKSDFVYRLETPDRACRGGVRHLTIGALLGLDDFRSEALLLALHLRYLQKTYPNVELSVAFPRIRPTVGGYVPRHPITDHQFVQVIAAFRVLFPMIGITLSTRESPKIRDGLVHIAVTKMSAGVSTAVRGHTHAESIGQFEIADTRSVDQVMHALVQAGFQPVLHTWNKAMTSGQTQPSAV